jgi:hypothetical protein
LILQFYDHSQLLRAEKDGFSECFPVLFQICVEFFTRICVVLSHSGWQQSAPIIPEQAWMTIMKRRMEIITIERQRIVTRPASSLCPVCQSKTELLTTRQAGWLFQVKAASIRRWLTQGKAHGIRTPGGQHRICKNSLFCPTEIVHPAGKLNHLNEPARIAEHLLLDIGGTH